MAMDHVPSDSRYMFAALGGSLDGSGHVEVKRLMDFFEQFSLAVDVAALLIDVLRDAPYPIASAALGYSEFVEFLHHMDAAHAAANNDADDPAGALLAPSRRHSLVGDDMFDEGDDHRHRHHHRLAELPSLTRGGGDGAGSSGDASPALIGSPLLSFSSDDGIYSNPDSEVAPNGPCDPPGMQMPPSLVSPTARAHTLPRRQSVGNLSKSVGGASLLSRGRSRFALPTTGGLGAAGRAKTPLGESLAQCAARLAEQLERIDLSEHSAVSQVPGIPRKMLIRNHPPGSMRPYDETPVSNAVMSRLFPPKMPAMDYKLSEVLEIISQTEHRMMSKWKVARRLPAANIAFAGNTGLSHSIFGHGVGGAGSPSPSSPTVRSPSPQGSNGTRAAYLSTVRQRYEKRALPRWKEAFLHPEPYIPVVSPARRKAKPTPLATLAHSPSFALPVDVKLQMKQLARQAVPQPSQGFTNPDIPDVARRMLLALDGAAERTPLRSHSRSSAVDAHHDRQASYDGGGGGALLPPSSPSRPNFCPSPQALAVVHRRSSSSQRQQQQQQEGHQPHAAGDRAPFAAEGSGTWLPALRSPTPAAGAPPPPPPVLGSNAELSAPSSPTSLFGGPPVAATTAMVWSGSTPPSAAASPKVGFASTPLHHNQQQQQHPQQQPQSPFSLLRATPQVPLSAFDLGIPSAGVAVLPSSPYGGPILKKGRSPSLPFNGGCAALVQQQQHPILPSGSSPSASIVGALLPTTPVAAAANHHHHHSSSIPPPSSSAPLLPHHQRSRHDASAALGQPNDGTAAAVAAAAVAVGTAGGGPSRSLLGSADIARRAASTAARPGTPGSSTGPMGRAGALPQGAAGAATLLRHVAADRMPPAVPTAPLAMPQELL